LSSDDLASKPEAVVRQAMDFIGVDPDEIVDLADVVKVQFNIAPESRNGEDSEPVLSDAVRLQLSNFYKPFNDDFARRFGVDTSSWT
jgi:hypothetical protein